MSIPANVEQLEEFAEQIGADAENLFQVWFANHVPGELQERVRELFELAKSGKERARMPFRKMNRWSRGLATANLPST
jgi:hypothetical protein